MPTTKKKEIISNEVINKKLAFDMLRMPKGRGSKSEKISLYSSQITPNPASYAAQQTNKR